VAGSRTTAVPAVALARVTAAASDFSVWYWMALSSVSVTEAPSSVSDAMAPSTMAERPRASRTPATERDFPLSTPSRESSTPSRPSPSMFENPRTCEASSRWG